MIIYNVTVNVESSISDDWENWMRQTHIPEVLATGLFTGYKFLILLSRQPEEVGKTFAVQYTLRDLDDYEKYQTEFAPVLQKAYPARFEGKFFAFRTLLQEI